MSLPIQRPSTLSPLSSVPGVDVGAAPALAPAARLQNRAPAKAGPLAPRLNPSSTASSAPPRVTLADLLAAQPASAPAVAATPIASGATAPPNAAASVLRSGVAAQRLLERASRSQASTPTWLRGKPRPLEGPRLRAFDQLVRSDVLAYAKQAKLEPRIAASRLHREALQGGLAARISPADRDLMLSTLARMSRGQPLQQSTRPVPPPDDRFAAERLPTGPLPADARYPMVTGLLKKYAGEEVMSPQGTQVKFLDPQERRQYELRMIGGRLYDSAGRRFDTSTAASSFLETGGTAIFVMDAGGRLYAATERVAGQFQHSSFLAGGAVAAAGEMAVRNGVVTFLSGKSGHYRPSQMQIDQLAHRLAAGGQTGYERDSNTW